MSDAGDSLRKMGFAVSEHGDRCAEFACRFYSGMHHFPTDIARVDWSHPYFVRWRQMEGLCSFDGDALTRLVFLAHDTGIRVEVNPSMRYLEIVCHPRVFTRTEGRAKPHPTLETAVATWRRYSDARPEPTVDREVR